MAKHDPFAENLVIVGFLKVFHKVYLPICVQLSDFAHLKQILALLKLHLSEI